MEDAGLLLLAAALGFGGWRYSVWRWPTRRCPSCDGRGTNAGSSALRWGTCRRCGGRGYVRRRGARRP